MPSLVGRQATDAVSALNDAHLKAAVLQVPSAKPAGEEVTAQDPPPGTKQPEGSVVHFNVSKGPTPRYRCRASSASRSTQRNWPLRRWASRSQPTFVDSERAGEQRDRPGSGRGLVGGARARPSTSPCRRGRRPRRCLIRDALYLRGPGEGEARAVLEARMRPARVPVLGSRRPPLLRPPPPRGRFLRGGLRSRLATRGSTGCTRVATTSTCEPMKRATSWTTSGSSDTGRAGLAGGALSRISLSETSTSSAPTTSTPICWSPTSSLLPTTRFRPLRRSGVGAQYTADGASGVVGAGDLAVADRHIHASEEGQGAEQMLLAQPVLHRVGAVPASARRLSTTTS